MLARAGANLCHIAPTCSALRIAKAPASPLSPPQTSRQAEAESKNLAAAGARGETKARADSEGGFGLEA